MIEKITTRFVPYSCGVESPAYKAICHEREEAGVELMRVYSTRTDRLDMGPERDIVLSTEFVFGNQWNSEPDQYTDEGFRVFNWYEEIMPDRYQRKGHYLVITDQMREVVASTYKCGYCDKHYRGHGHAGLFCHACLDSEYLKANDLLLLRLMPGSLRKSHATRPPLSEAEATIMMPKYIEAQTRGNAKRKEMVIEKQREKWVRKLEVADEEYDGMMWLLSRDMNTENVIYYEHTRTFSFGWCSSLSDEVKAKLTELLAEFPFKYELK